MKDDLMPIIVVIAILVLIYLVMKLINNKMKKRINKSDYHKRRRL